MFQYSPILGRSSIWDLKFTFSKKRKENEKERRRRGRRRKREEEEEEEEEEKKKKKKKERKKEEEEEEEEEEELKAFAKMKKLNQYISISPGSTTCRNTYNNWIDA